MKIYLAATSWVIVAFANLKLILMCPMSLWCVCLPQGKPGVKGQPPHGSLTVAYLLLVLMSSHNTCLFIYLGRFYVRLKSTCISSVLLQYYQPTHLYTLYNYRVYLGRFYVRSKVIRKSPPDYCVGKSVLHGKILRKNFDLT